MSKIELGVPPSCSSVSMVFQRFSFLPLIVLVWSGFQSNNLLSLLSLWVWAIWVDYFDGVVNLFLLSRWVVIPDALYYFVDSWGRSGFVWSGNFFSDLLESLWSCWHLRMLLFWRLVPREFRGCWMFASLTTLVLCWELLWWLICSQMSWSFFSPIWLVGCVSEQLLLTFVQTLLPCCCLTFASSSWNGLWFRLFCLFLLVCFGNLEYFWMPQGSRFTGVWRQGWVRATLAACSSQ